MSYARYPNTADEIVLRKIILSHHLATKSSLKHVVKLIGHMINLIPNKGKNIITDLLTAQTYAR